MKVNALFRGLALAAAAALTASLMAACGGSQDPSSSAGSEGSSGGSQVATGESSATENGSTGSESGSAGSESGSTGSHSGENGSTSAVTTGSATNAPTSLPTRPTDPDTVKEDLAFYKEIVEIETQWLADMILPNGAFPMTPVKDGTVKMNPYFADFGALAILDGDKKHIPAVKRYMDWHFSHLNTAETDYNGVDGTIYDYHIKVSGGNVVQEDILILNGKKEYDSTDSYAATFLMVLWKYYEKTGDKAYIVNHYSDIERIVGALYATMYDGLTTAKPDYPVKYLMDNCEVWEGIGDAINLYEKVLVPQKSGASATLSKLKASYTEVARQIEKLMWNEDDGYYYPALGMDGEPNYTFSWGNFYPSATAQLFVIASGLLKPTDARAQKLYSDFNSHYSTGESKKDWDHMSIPDSFYWGSLVHVAAIMGDDVRVKNYMTMYRKVMKNHAYPLYNADAGKACMAAAIMVEKLSALG